MTVIDRVVEIERNLRGERQPVLVELLGTVLALGLFVRGTVHVYVALVARETIAPDVSPELAGTDVTAASPVEALRGHWLDVVARATALCVGAGLWLYIEPLSGGELWMQWFAVANLSVVMCDPFWFALAERTPR